MKASASGLTVDTFARPGWFVVRVDLPDVPAHSIRVELSAERLTVSGRRARRSFFRHVLLPAGAWPNKARVDLRDGILDVRVPVVGDGAEYPAPTAA